MTFSPLEVLGLASFFGFVSSTATKVWLESRQKDCVTHDELDDVRDEIARQCSENMSHCSGASVKDELKQIRALLGVMCERMEISARERLQIERDAR